MLVEWASDQETPKKKKKVGLSPLIFHKSTTGGSHCPAPRTTREKEREKRGRGRDPGLVVDRDGGPMKATIRLLDAEVELGRLEGREREVERE